MLSEYAIAIFCAIAVIDAAAASTNEQHAAEATNHLTKLKTKESMYKAASSAALQEIRLAEKDLQHGGVTALIQTSASAQDGTASAEDYWNDARVGTTTSQTDTICKNWASTVSSADCEGGEDKGIVVNFKVIGAGSARKYIAQRYGVLKVGGSYMCGCWEANCDKVPVAESTTNCATTRHVTDSAWIENGAYTKPWNEFFLASMGSTSCGKLGYFPVGSASKCQAAADALGSHYTYKGSGSYESDPKGCGAAESSGNMYFNTHGTGSSSSVMGVVCSGLGATYAEGIFI